MALQTTRRSRRVNPKFSGDARADAAVKSILLSLFGYAQLNEKRILEQDSPVAIHAFRVALRRSRSLLAFSHGILPESRIRMARKTLAWVMADSNVIRDRQVMQAKLKNCAPELPTQCRKTFLTFRQLLQADIERELVHLRKQLQSKRYQSFKQSWEHYLGKQPPLRSRLYMASSPISRVSAQSIESAWSRVLEKGSHIKTDTPAEDIHKLRIACKKYRYCLEFFRPDERAEQELLALESLQDSLGELQDIAVQYGLIQGVRCNATLEPECLDALRAVLKNREQLLRQQALNEFHRFRQSRKHGL